MSTFIGVVLLWAAFSILTGLHIRRQQKKYPWKFYENPDESEKLSFKIVNVIGATLWPLYWIVTIVGYIMGVVNVLKNGGK